ncbi:MAG: hypothetical protein IPI71_09480 [Methanolinea sp.]|nr:MAG: hypothetical protein IPI71_09480 [Methanolinea sp.]
MVYPSFSEAPHHGLSGTTPAWPGGSGKGVISGLHEGDRRAFDRGRPAGAGNWVSTGTWRG